MLRVITLVIVIATVTMAHNSYTGGYSGAPGKTTCASSCHGGSSGTMVVSGFPTSYTPGQIYTITITHNGGNKIVNVNATTRLGSTTNVAGSFTAGSNSALYTGADGGIYTSPHLVDAVVFQWKAPAAGSGPVTFYAAGYQATSTSSAGGQTTKVSITAVEVTTNIEQIFEKPGTFSILQNYPNPFNPQTNIRFSVPKEGFATLKIYNIIGHHVATLFEEHAIAGMLYVRTFNACGMSSGPYFARLESPGYVRIMKLVLTK
jgi:hypothetical protein